jgi:hypothetical protein
VIGDSASAHFGIPPQYLMPDNQNGSMVYANLVAFAVCEVARESTRVSLRVANCATFVSDFIFLCLALRVACSFSILACDLSVLGEQADEADWPQCSWATGHANDTECPPHTVPINSVR